MLILENLSDLQNYVGKKIGASDWMEVKQARIKQFAEATEDRQWIHIDRERASRESPFRSTIAHGFLTLSLVSYLMQQTFQVRGGLRMAINYGLNRVRFPSPVRESAKIRGHFSLQSFKDLGDSFEAVYACTIECHGSEKPVCVAEWVVRYYK